MDKRGPCQSMAAVKSAEAQWPPGDTVPGGWRGKKQRWLKLARSRLRTLGARAMCQTRSVLLCADSGEEAGGCGGKGDGDGGGGG